MRDLGQRVVEVTRGLGEHVTICGLSMGGTLAAWIAQHVEVDLAVVIAPPLEVAAIPHALHRLAAELFQRLPNFFVWWDPKTKLNNPNRALFGYPRYASHALAESWRLAYALRHEARQTPPMAKRILVISNANDHTVRNGAVRALTQDWQRLAPGRVQTYEFPAELGLLHDFIGPYLPGQKIDVAYPTLLELMG
jgi:carboxylesterase